MTEAELTSTLHDLIAKWESEVVEFKEAGEDFDTDKIGRYVSALSNEANLRGLPEAWLVFGVSNKTRSIVGTNYRLDAVRLQGLKLQIEQDTEPGLTFRNIHVVDAGGYRVVMFEIPSAPRGIPIAWKGHYYARAGESLVSLGLDKLDAIRNQTLASDWSAQVVPNATLADLDPEAVLKAREAFKNKHANRIPTAEVDGWTDQNFLDRAKLTQNGRLTRAAILLLGKDESTFLLSPHPAQLTWKLVGAEEAYEHFGPPFFLNTSKLYQRIRNIQIRIQPEDQLIPVEISKYDRGVVLEALHNCIAHQDYSQNSRVTVTEQLDKLIFQNAGNFYEGKPDEYVGGHKTPGRYRNAFLTQAMVQLNMIDTMGFGIHRMHSRQRDRYLPMPDYEIDGNVIMTIYGGVVDPSYSMLLMKRTNLPIADVLALDRVQKKLPIPDEVAKHLRVESLIEGRKPAYHVSAKVAAVTGQKAQYIRNRALTDERAQEMIVELLTKFNSASRKDVDELLLKSLSDALSDKQKRYKIGNLLSNLRKSGKIRNVGSRVSPRWEIAE